MYFTKQQKKDAHEECKKLGIEPDVKQRWAYGIKHHPFAEKIFALLEESDLLFGGDFFEWRKGGDGDNGETLMYMLSVLLEMQEQIDVRCPICERKLK